MDTPLSTLDHLFTFKHHGRHSESRMYPLPIVILLNILEKFSFCMNSIVKINAGVPLWQCCLPSRSSAFRIYPSLPMYANIGAYPSISLYVQLTPSFFDPVLSKGDTSPSITIKSLWHPSVPVHAFSKAWPRIQVSACEHLGLLSRSQYPFCEPIFRIASSFTIFIRKGETICDFEREKRYSSTLRLTGAAA